MFLCDSRGTLRDNACAVVSRAFGVLCLSLKCLVSGSQPSKWPYDLTLRCPCCREQRVHAMGFRCGVTSPGVWPHHLSKSLALWCALLSRWWWACACMDKLVRSLCLVQTHCQNPSPYTRYSPTITHNETEWKQLMKLYLAEREYSMKSIIEILTHIPCERIISWGVRFFMISCQVRRILTFISILFNFLVHIGNL